MKVMRHLRLILCVAIMVVILLLLAILVKHAFGEWLVRVQL